MPILVLGHPRGGTRYIHNLLDHLPVDCAHEGLARDVAVSYRHALLVDPRKHFRQIWHQLREPRTAVASIASRWAMPAQRILDDNFDGCDSEDPVHVAAKFLVRWHTRAWSLDADLTYQVEHVERVWPAMLELLELPYQEMPDIPKNAGADRKTTGEKVSWESLGPWEYAIRELCRRYDYPSE